MRNVEVKIRCHDLDAARAAAREMGATLEKSFRQRDVFFDVPHGRLKLRRDEGSPPVLIAYVRDDAPEARTSTFHLLELTDDQGDQAEELLGLVSRPIAVVRKQRDLFLWRNVRIHIDSVDGLGEFVEFEVVDEDDEARGRETIARLMREMNLRDDDIAALAYADMPANDTHRGDSSDR